MTSRKATLYAGIILALAIIAMGAANGKALKDCMEAGNSKETCYRVMKP